MTQAQRRPMALPTQVRPAQGRIGSTLIYAAAKIGKSTQAVKMFPDALVLDTENGYNAIDAIVQPILDWRDFLEVGYALQEGQAANYPALIIDTGDRLAAMCGDYELRRLAGGAAQTTGKNAQRNFVHASDFEWGKGYAAIADEFALRVSKLMSLVPNLVIVCHADTIKLTERGQERTVMVPDLAPKGIRRFLEDTVDHIFYARVEDTEDGPQAVFRTHNGVDWRAGGRLPQGVAPLPDPMPFDGALLRRELEARMSAAQEAAQAAPDATDGAEAPQEAPKGGRGRQAARKPAEEPREAQGQLEEAAA